MKSPTSIRFPQDLCDNVELVARIKDVTATSIIHTAVDQYVKQEMNDPDFKIQLQARIKADQQILEELSGM